ncbi:hypothetical protein [Lactococcus garvieae]|uniref:hypothetical protein n=1 Tax=Lactococcus garvieae TaxID=1363 RepID=UPI0022DF59A7|nr:hypothetical protein [Lactococcus garvieae]
MAERLTKVAIVDVYQYGKVIFTGNSYEVKEHFDFSSKQFARLTAMGKAVQKGSTPRPQTMYAIKVGEEKTVTHFTHGATDLMGSDRFNPEETKEERRLRRRVLRDMARERFYKS